MPEFEDWQHGGFGIYIHWPFCEAKCPYCDFNSHVVAQIDQSAWERAYLAEIERIGALTPQRVLNSVFFGGGTPSLMNPDIVDNILKRIRETWPVANDLEVTLEANPTSVEAGRFKGYFDAGINRLSMGIQALNDDDLKALGRLHSTKDAMQAFDIARSIFERVSFDLIYARQKQSVAAWKEELSKALSMAIDHISLYQLTIEYGTAFGDRYKAGKLRGLPDEDLGATLYEVTQDVCQSHGFETYEISNHAKPGSESLHNRIYWMYGDYAGIGPGAHGRLTLNGHRHATEGITAPGAWLNNVKTVGHGDVSIEVLTPDEQFAEFLLMGLRLREGIELNRFKGCQNNDFLRKIKILEEIGVIKHMENRLCLTEQGRPILNTVLQELLKD